MTVLLPFDDGPASSVVQEGLLPGAAVWFHAARSRVFLAPPQGHIVR
jgi:hypothetical protein